MGATVYDPRGRTVSVAGADGTAVHGRTERPVGAIFLSACLEGNGCATHHLARDG